MPKVSVVIPVYGVEKYIERCARSLFSQTIDDIEYIFVDDCSKDNSIEILKETIKDYPERIPHISIITHQTNKGLPQARKTGVLAATGDYIVHCDSDDWVDANLYETMYQQAMALDADCIVCDFITHTKNGKTVRKGTRVDNVRTYTVNLLFQKDPVSMWNKMIRRTVYCSGIEFPVLNMGEDMATTLQLVRHCRKIGWVTGACYHYDGTTASITREETKDATVMRASQACINARMVIERYSKDLDEDYENGIIHLKYMQRRLYMPAINHRDVYLLWKQTFPEINRDVLFKKSVKIPILERFKFFLTLVNIFPWIKEYTRKNLK